MRWSFTIASITSLVLACNICKCMSKLRLPNISKFSQVKIDTFYMLQHTFHFIADQKNSRSRPVENSFQKILQVCIEDAQDLIFEISKACGGGFSAICDHFRIPNAVFMVMMLPHKTFIGFCSYCWKSISIQPLKFGSLLFFTCGFLYLTKAILKAVPLTRDDWDYVPSSDEIVNFLGVQSRVSDSLYLNDFNKIKIHAEMENYSVTLASKSCLVRTEDDALQDSFDCVPCDYLAATNFSSTLEDTTTASYLDELVTLQTYGEAILKYHGNPKSGKLG